MNTMDNLIFLKGGDTYITNSEANAYKVMEGTVLVYVVPLKNGTPGRRSFVYQAMRYFPVFHIKILNTVNGDFVLLQ